MYNKLNILKMIRKNIWNNNLQNSNISSNTNNNKYFRFILQGNTNTNNRLLSFSSNQVISICIKGHYINNDVLSSHYSNNFITSDIEYVTIYKKDNEFNFIGDNNNCIIKFEKPNTDFYFSIEIFSPSQITYISDFSIILI